MKHILIFGASTVHGVGDTHGGWADRLKQSFYAQMFGSAGERTAEVYELGIPGDTLQGMQARFEPELRARRKNERDEVVIVFSAGANDALAHDEGQPLVRTADDFGALVHSFVHLVKDYTPAILGVGITPMDAAKLQTAGWAIDTDLNQRLASFEEAFQRTCDAEGIPFVPLFNQVPADWAQQYLHVDGIHPNDAGHQWICDQVAAALQGIS